MHHLISLLSQCRDFRRLVETLESGDLRQTGSSPTFPCFSIHGVSRSARACYVASLWPYLRRPCLILTADTESTSHVATELESLIPSLLATDGTTDVVPRVLVLPSHDLLFEATSLPDPQVVQDRLAVLDAWHHDEPVFVVAPINAFAGFLVPRDLFRHGTFTLRVGVEQNLEELMRRLVDDGYHRVDTVEQVSEFSVRGGIVDVFPPTLDKPLRLEFFGDEIVSLRQFDPQTQRSFESLDQCEISPPREMILTPPTVQAAIPRIRGALQEQQKTLSEQGREEARELLAETVELDLQRLEQLAYFPGVERYLPFLYSEGTRLVDYVPSQTLIFCDDLARLHRSWSQLADAFNEYLGDKVKAGAFLPSPLPWYPDLGTLLQRLRGHVSCNLITAAPDPGLPERSPNTTFFTEFQMLPSFQGQVALLAERLKRWQDERKHIVCSTHHPQRLLELFRDTGVSAVRLAMPTGSGTEHQVKQRRQRQKALPPGEIEVATYGVAAGFELPEAKLIFLTDAEIFGWSGVHRRWRKRREGSVAIASPVDLDLGDYVVHISHGIGLYQGISRQTVRGSEGEYLLIQYAGADRLFVPVHQIDRIHKFIGSNGVAPALSSLSGVSWETTKKKALKAAKDIAEDLAKLYSAREQAEGHSFPPDSPWQREMEVSFEWEETPDQAKAIEVVKEDMESESPMDRLICGDVGYGKTEVALRAAFKSVQDNKQVAVLVPTTVLAQQHFNTFRERLAPYPVTIDLLSRFRSRIEQERIVKSIRAGSVDIVIGTHRLLSKDMKFKDLGLLIIDEEHRFGVEQKEILKQLKTEVDVLTLTATPIPRTLHMALGGIRNMSIINDPPRGRLPVQTYVTQFEDDLVRTAVLREMERGGQVLFVHNRVRSIRHVASHIARLLPTARIAIGHGQLPEDELEEIMLDFYNGQYDILLCTTIIESGLDIPNANTLIVDRCEHFGLAQLYQLRGRVGRSDRQAYAYFLYGRHAKLGHAMEQRIEALKEFSGLGSGFKVALRDLEIRGAGNLLGAEQHGNIQSVGFDLYCEMLSQAVSEIHNKPMETHRDFPEVDLPVSAYLSEDYIPNLNQRLDIYRRLASVEVLKDVDSLETELEDRFGVMPAPVSNLLRIMRLRLGCQSISVERISQSEREMLLRFTPRARPSQGECLKLYRELSASHSHDLLNAVKIKPEGMSLNPRGLDPQTTLGFIEDIVHTMATWRVS